MRRREIIKRISKAARKAGLSWEVAREGSNHTVYRLDGLMIPIPRHTEIGENTTRDIFQECDPKLGKDWWRK